MATVVATRAGANRPSAAAGHAQDLKRAWGSITVGDSYLPAAADVMVMCKLPKGALIVGGALKGTAIEIASLGSGLLSLNIGLDKAVITPGGTTVNAASTSIALASHWVLGSDVTGAAQLATIGSLARNSPLGGLLMTHGPLLTTDECNAYITINASAFRYVTGPVILEIDYYQQQHV